MTPNDPHPRGAMTTREEITIDGVTIVRDELHDGNGNETACLRGEEPGEFTHVITDFWALKFYDELLRLRAALAAVTKERDAEYEVRRMTLHALSGQGLPRTLPEHGHGVITDAHALYQRMYAAESALASAREEVLTVREELIGMKAFAEKKISEKRALADELAQAREEREAVAAVKERLEREVWCATPEALKAFDGVQTCGACPVQYEGRVEGHRWYFRSRGERFSLRVAETTSDAEFAGVEGEEILSGSLAPRFDFLAGYMSYSVAVALIEWGLTLWKSERAKTAIAARAGEEGR